MKNKAEKKEEGDYLGVGAIAERYGVRGRTRKGKRVEREAREARRAREKAKERAKERNGNEIREAREARRAVERATRIALDGLLVDGLKCRK